jgi:hypothetical protein
MPSLVDGLKAYSRIATIKGMTNDLSFNLQALRAKYAWIGTVIIIAKRGYQLNPSYQLNPGNPGPEAYSQ